jgi:hypothetical protein
MWWPILILACADVPKDAGSADPSDTAGGLAEEDAPTEPPTEPEETDTDADTGLGEPVLSGGMAFWEAELVPPFEHGNAARIEVALKYRTLPPYILRALQLDDIVDRLKVFTIDQTTLEGSK